MKGYDAEFAYDVPETLAHVLPAAGCAVHQPPKLYPDRVNEFDVNDVADDADCELIDPEPPLLSKVTVYV